MSYFDGIRPCGLSEPVVSLAELLDPVPTMGDVKQAVISAFGDIFDFEMSGGGAFPV
jgi:lipoate-protein ligase B